MRLIIFNSFGQKSAKAMRNNSFIRRYEPWFFVGVAILYVVQRLVIEVARLDTMTERAGWNRVPSAGIQQNPGDYNYLLNNNAPLIAGMGIFLTSWYVFHNQAYPKLQERPDNPTGWLVTGLTVLLLLAAMFVYHYLKLYPRYQHDQAGNVIGLTTYSLYRKRTILADAVGLGIVLGVYEATFQYYAYLSRKIAQDSTRHFRLVSYLLLGGLVMGALMAALKAEPPLFLWNQRGSRNVLMLSGLGLQILALQGYIYSYILPLLRGSLTTETMRAARTGTYLFFVLPFLQSSSVPEVLLARRVATYLLTIFVTTLILWGATTAFHYDNRDPLLLMAIVLIASVSVAYGRQAFTQEKTVLQTQVSTGAAELASLRAQINPHFLFNALNSLYATALKENSEKTADGIQKLGDMMRFMLQENNRDRIPLDKEIEYLRNYIGIQRMRIDESHNIEIRVTIQEPNRVLYIAPMLLTPFVENAFKYGISLRHASWIYITLTLDDSRLYFKVHNSRHTRSPDMNGHHDPEAVQSGVGLDNVRKRLALIYPGRHQLDIQQSEQDYFVSLSLVYG
ncbi:sensor histidine kinase [Spirosoma spitsbergense]|uniref:sensor histidine kinase n=1 Tax=Spirosoma spitsbergense TaxID=431554 RepID=UPI001FDF487D|nr:histidine kinase [Spirosoma spitsbergense]